MDAAETLFVPACVYNNTKDDDDARVREAFEEPAWNNPVVRIVDADRKDVVQRLANDWTLGALANAMVAALDAREAEVPAYLRMLATEEAARKRGVERAAFGMT